MTMATLTRAAGAAFFSLASVAAVAGPAEELAGRADWHAGGGVEMRTTNGTKGQGNLDILAERAFVEGMVSDWRVNLTLVRALVETGMPQPNTFIGRRAGVDTSAPMDGADIYFPMLSARREIEGWSYGARLSSTPMNGPISAQPTGGVNVTRYGQSVILNGRLFSDPVVGSMLSYTGMRDPVTGRYWGRVTDNGGAAQATWLATDRIGIGAGLERAYLRGQDVKDNARMAARVDAAYDFRPDGFDHLRLGPFVSYAHFDHNLSHYTYGHGGYYSPQRDWRQGLLLDALTTEGRQWQVEFKSSLALGQAWEAASPHIWVGDGNRTWEGSSNHGLNSEVSLRASALLTDQLILSGFARYQAAPQYTDMALGAFLTVPFSPRGGVFSADLPDSVFTPFR